jgi:hypothetical protein
MLRPLERLAVRIAVRSARPEWTLLAVAYSVSGAVVWAMRMALGEAG